MGKRKDTIQVIGVSSGCQAGARVDLYGPESNPQTISNVGTIDANGQFDVEYYGPEVAAGRWSVIIVNPDGTECCRSGFVDADVRRGNGGGPWG